MKILLKKHFLRARVTLNRVSIFNENFSQNFDQFQKYRVNANKVHFLRKTLVLLLKFFMFDVIILTF